MLRVRNGLWIWSDTHFGHRNIVKFQQRPETHETIMLSNWATRVRDDDQILHLGDVFLDRKGFPGRWPALIARMPGEKFLVKGNHDDEDNARYELAGFTVIEPFVFRRIAFTHEPIGTLFNPGDFPLDSWDVNIHGHIHRGQMGSKARDGLEQHDGFPWEGKTYLNVSVEETGLAPVQLGNVFRLPPKEGGE
jgi:calcineurin-like phosphoesterase family protein